MTTIRSLIEARLAEGLQPERLIVLDESAAHAGHAGAREGGESHFRVRIVTAAFAGVGRVERHRRINGLLAEAFARGLHALAIEAAAPGEPVRW
jgi:BolA protein